MKQSICILLFIIISGNLCGQALSTPDGIVHDNATSDQILVNGNTKLVNPNGRTLLIERDDEDSWLTFHDPNNYWFSMGIDQSNNGLFTLSSGGYLGVASHFLMNSSGDIAIGKSQPSHKLDLNGNFQVYPGANAGSNGALKLRFIPSPSASIIQANSDFVWADHDIIINGANSLRATAISLLSTARGMLAWG